MRGRKDDEDTNDGLLHGYTMQSVATLRNKMRDDLDVIYFQWGKSKQKQERKEKQKQIERMLD